MPFPVAAPATFAEAREKAYIAYMFQCALIDQEVARRQVVHLRSLTKRSVFITECLGITGSQRDAVLKLGLDLEDLDDRYVVRMITRNP